MNEKWEYEIYEIYYININLMKWKEIYLKWKNEDFMMIVVMNILEMNINYKEMKLMIYYKYI